MECSLVVASIRESDAEIKRKHVVSSSLRSPNVTALKLSVMPSMLATDTDCGSFTGYDAFVTISESGGTTGSSERTVAVTPCAQVPLTATGIPQLNEDGMPTILITLASR